MGHEVLYSTLGNGGTVYSGAKSDPSMLLEDLALVRPTELDFLVPRVWEMLFHEFHSEANRQTSDHSDRTAIQARVLTSMRQNLLGGRYIFAITGSAPVSEPLKAWVKSLLDMHLIVGYGTTEAGKICLDGVMQNPPVLDYKLRTSPRPCRRPPKRPNYSPTRYPRLHHRGHPAHVGERTTHRHPQAGVAKGQGALRRAAGTALRRVRSKPGRCAQLIAPQRRRAAGTATWWADAHFVELGSTRTVVHITLRMRRWTMFSDGDGYQLLMGRWSRELALLFVAFAQIGEGCTVLDVGCGTGELTYAAAETGSVNATGIDRSAAYIRAAQRRAGGRSVRFEVGDAQTLPFVDGTFDRTLAMLVLNFVPEPAAALHEMIRVTRNDGVVAAAVWDYGDGMGMLRTFWNEAVTLLPDAASRDERHMPLCRAGELGELWQAQGLRHVLETSLTIETVFSSFDDYWRSFQTGQGPSGSFAASLSTVEQHGLRARLRDRLLGAGPDRPFSLPARAWVVRGVVSR